MTKKQRVAKMASDQFPKAEQTAARLESSAELALSPGAPVCAALPAGNARPTLVERVEHVYAAVDKQNAQPSCQQSLCLNFFFDGTGNNLEADSPTSELSNVAKLYLAHPESDKVQGIYRIYIPGIGTRFKEISDPGGTTKGLAFGAEGEARIKWAFEQFEEKLKIAESLATNPTNKITMVRVSAFGFSRGATEARAFARDFQKKLCRRVGAEWQLTAGGYPVRFYFLGLWDTVASVGLPMSANNMPAAQSLGWMNTAAALRARNMSTNGVTTLAFGQPGADPAPGPADGHGSWASPLDIPSMVEKCVHMVAAHEVRNSFPLDSCRRGMSYPETVEEMVYPGVHSDVGGGYRPGEGARSAKPGQMLSLIPLRAMHQKAREAGVPLVPLTAFEAPMKERFGADEASQTEFNTLNDLWRHYMQQAGYGGRGIGQMFNAHMRLYYGWRFYRIRKNRAARANGGDTPDQATLRQREADWRKERDQLSGEMAPLKKRVSAAQTQLDRAKTRLALAEQDQRAYGTNVDPALQRNEGDAQARFDEVNDSYLKLKARQDTLPGTEGVMGQNLNTYDDQLVADAEAIRATLEHSPGTPLRPHYQNLLDAYLAEEGGDGLRDEKVIAFFDTYVHDSLAGFGRDSTLPSDPRVIYIGDDTKSLHAKAVLPGDQRSVHAA